MLISLISNCLTATVLMQSAPTPPATPPMVRLTAWVSLDEVPEHTTHLALQVDQQTADRLLESVLNTPATAVNTDGGLYGLYQLDLEILDGVELDSQWRMSGEVTDVICTVAGFDLITSSLARPGATAENAGAPCYAPLFTARMACDTSASGATLAVPASAPTPVWGELIEGELAPAARDRLLALPEVAAVEDIVTGKAVQRDERVQTEMITWTYRLGNRHLQMVEGRFYTGEGEDGCGADDIVGRWFAVLDGGPPRAFESGNFHGSDGVLDLEGDGRLETVEWIDGQQVLLDVNRVPLRSHRPDWCVCGC